MTDFRALCARMADELDHYRQLLMDDRRETHALAAEARTALAEPQPPADGEVAELAGMFRHWAREYPDSVVLDPQWLTRAADLLERLSDGPAVQSREPASVTTKPSDEELLELMPQQMRDDLAAAARALAGFDPDNIKAASVFRIILNRHIADYARAVLARWCNYPAQPIPVSERLPEAGDCIANPRNGQGQWCWGWKGPGSVETVAVLFSGEWRMMRREWLTNDATHWLPFRALPLPSGEVAQ